MLSDVAFPKIFTKISEGQRFIGTIDEKYGAKAASSKSRLLRNVKSLYSRELISVITCLRLLRSWFVFPDIRGRQLSMVVFAILYSELNWVSLSKWNILQSRVGTH